jgi:hypothetical protein
MYWMLLATVAKGYYVQANEMNLPIEVMGCMKLFLSNPVATSIIIGLGSWLSNSREDWQAALGDV